MAQGAIILLQITSTAFASFQFWEAKKKNVFSCFARHMQRSWCWLLLAFVKSSFDSLVHCDCVVHNETFCANETCTDGERYIAISQSF